MKTNCKIIYLVKDTQPKFKNTQLKKFQAALSRCYVDPGNVVSNLLEICRSYAEKWDPEIFFSLYTSLIKPSGSGKTRIALEAGKKTFAFYCCLREDNSSGVPRRSYVGFSY